jgi:hypothetical protein
MAKQFEMRKVWDFDVSSGRSACYRAHVCVTGVLIDNGSHEWTRTRVVIVDLRKLIPASLVVKRDFFSKRTWHWCCFLEYVYSNILLPRGALILGSDYSCKISFSLESVERFKLLIIKK